MSSPFTTDSNQALQAHHGFAQAAMGVGVRRISISNQSPKAVGTSAHGCYKPAPAKSEALFSDRGDLECPHCGAVSVFRIRRITDEKFSPEASYCCTNKDCGHAFVARTESITTPAQEDRPSHAPELPNERTRLECPHCDTPSLIRSSRRITKLTREVTYCCNNPECGHTFVAHTEIVRTLSPSATPDPSIHLPLSTHVRRDLVRAQMDYAQQSQHCPVFTKPLTGDLFGGNPPPAD
ncbi:ogr/Delta-like zinc finger family protein [Comamonas antarctica]|uniref:Ogr/Delta-like zinc finger family protein n=1 Tax=Comamonas antarctica TaxID=2743470 RepID=A0A6N1X2V1_9BURK|nr:ogr/Delta-like zinc finger family protein [Comamonas antarctica]QKV52372.1 ogr/Delta-like zinc finger family protein [Comamonas antarctica]